MRRPLFTRSATNKMPNNEMKRTCLRYSHSCSRIYYLCVCDWQIIIHTWLRHGRVSFVYTVRRMCEDLHMCLHMAFIVMDPNVERFAKSIWVGIIFEWKRETSSQVLSTHIAHTHTHHRLQMLKSFWIQAKLASHNFPIYCGVVTSINADNNILRG